MRAVFLFFILLVRYSAGNYNVKVNSMIDFEYKAMNRQIRRAHKSYLSLGSYERGGWNVSESWIGDFSTFYRIGDATVKELNDSTLSTTVTYGLKKLHYGMKQLSKDNKTYTDVVFVANNSSTDTNYDITFDDQGACSMVIHKYVFNLGTVNMYAKEPSIKGVNVTDSFKFAQDKVNAYYKSNDFKRLLERLQPCTIGIRPTLQHLISLWSSALYHHNTAFDDILTNLI